MVHREPTCGEFKRTRAFLEVDVVLDEGCLTWYRIVTDEHMAVAIEQIFKLASFRLV